MKIGELAKATGVKIGTIRFYERKKLLKAAQRTAAGYRIYTEHDVQAVKGIRLTQELGFTLKEIKELLEIHESAKSFAGSRQANSKEWEKAFRIARERLALINQKIEFLKILKKPLAAVLEQPGAEKAMVCPASLMARPETGQTGKQTRKETAAAALRRKSA